MVRKRTLGAVAATIGVAAAVRRNQSNNESDTSTVDESQEAPAIQLSKAPDLDAVKNTVKITDSGIRLGKDTSESNSTSRRSWLSKFSVRAGVYLEHEDYNPKVSILEWRSDD